MIRGEAIRHFKGTVLERRRQGDTFHIANEYGNDVAEIKQLRYDLTDLYSPRRAASLKVVYEYNQTPVVPSRSMNDLSKLGPHGIH